MTLSRIHDTPDMVYRCPLCGQPHLSWSDRARHLHETHGWHLPAPTPEPKRKKSLGSGGTMVRIHDRALDVPDEARRAADALMDESSMPTRTADVVRAAIAYGYKHGKRATVGDMASWCAVSSRALNARLAKSGLPGCNALLILGMMMRACRMIVDRNHRRGRVVEVARELGYRDELALSSHMHHWLGWRPSKVTDARPETIARLLEGRRG